MIIRPKARFKDGVWYEEGYLAYADDYHTHPLPMLTYRCQRCSQKHTERAGALYWIAEGSSKEEAIDRLNAKLSTAYTPT